MKLNDDTNKEEESGEEGSEYEEESGEEGSGEEGSREYESEEDDDDWELGDELINNPVDSIVATYPYLSLE